MTMQDPASDDSQPIRTLIVEDGGFSREGVEPFLRPHGDIQVVGVARDRMAAATAIQRHSVDVIVMRLNDTHESIRTLRELRKNARTRVLLLMEQNEPSIARAARMAGADELLFGEQRPASVVTAVRKLGATTPQERSP